MLALMTSPDVRWDVSSTEKNKKKKKKKNQTKNQEIIYHENPYQLKAKKKKKTQRRCSSHAGSPASHSFALLICRPLRLALYPLSIFAPAKEMKALLASSYCPSSESRMRVPGRA